MAEEDKIVKEKVEHKIPGRVLFPILVAGAVSCPLALTTRVAIVNLPIFFPSEVLVDKLPLILAAAFVWSLILAIPMTIGTAMSRQRLLDLKDD